VRRLAALTAVLLLAGAAPARAWDSSPLAPQAVTARHHLCGEDDLKERGIQGDVPKADQESGRAEKGYNCGLALLGYTSLGKDGRLNQNANMGWAGNCAYISSTSGTSPAPQSKPNPPPGAGVAVVSVTDAGVPTYVGTLRQPGAVATSETINAVTTPTGRSILVVGQYGNDATAEPKPMDIYDVSDPDCAKYKHLATYYWPANIHNLTISKNGRYVFATLPLEVVDISALWDDNPRTGVRYVGNIEQEMDGPLFAPGPTADLDDNTPPKVRALSHPKIAGHEAWPSPDSKTLYVGGQTPQSELFSIVDIGDWLVGKGKPRVISQVAGRGHSVRTATIAGKPYVLHSEESVFGGAYGCLPQETAPFVGPAQPWLTDISDPAHPRTTVQFGLEINQPKNCRRQLDARENDSVHYHDVDNPDDTTFVMASMWNAGVRIFDIRHPKRPVEVAYFNPGDVDPSPAVKLDHAWGHVRWLPDRQQIWFATADGGFWVTRLESQVLRHLDLDAVGLTGERGHPGTRGARLPALSAYIDTARYYCTLAPVAA
jgi:hypothetical protein